MDLRDLLAVSVEAAQLGGEEVKTNLSFILCMDYCVETFYMQVELDCNNCLNVPDINYIISDNDLKGFPCVFVGSLWLPLTAATGFAFFF